jgi:2'-deoxynucleoside 5'-phosphate N-hydrolase
MKIYVAAALTHAPEEFKQRIEDLKKLLRRRHEVLEFMGLIKGTAQDVYRHDIDCVKNCDVLLADCSYPALGLGFEIATALQLNKTVLAISYVDAKVTRLILGIDHPNFRFVKYDTIDEISDQVQDRVKKND